MLRIANHHIYFRGTKTITVLPEGDPIVAAAQDNDEYHARAESLGYEQATHLMSREHEILHALLAHWTGQWASPTLLAVARGEKWEHWEAEEAAVLAIQRFLNCVDQRVEALTYPFEVAE
jgi:hypothetical protein